MTTIGFIGSGLIGSTLARLAIDAGYDVVLSNSRGPDTLADLVGRLGPKAGRRRRRTRRPRRTSPWSRCR
jgi:predicted dinucleotide-binding enzyme